MTTKVKLIKNQNRRNDFNEFGEKIQSNSNRHSFYKHLFFFFDWPQLRIRNLLFPIVDIKISIHLGIKQLVSKFFRIYTIIFKDAAVNTPYWTCGIISLFIPYKLNWLKIITTIWHEYLLSVRLVAVIEEIIACR